MVGLGLGPFGVNLDANRRAIESTSAPAATSARADYLLGRDRIEPRRRFV